MFAGFGFGQGEELSEHAASMAAMLFFDKGEATVGLGDDVQEALLGPWVRMPAGLKHSIKAKTPLVMLLEIFEAAEAALALARLVLADTGAGRASIEHAVRQILAVADLVTLPLYLNLGRWLLL